MHNSKSNKGYDEEGTEIAGQRKDETFSAASGQPDKQGIMTS